MSEDGRLKAMGQFIQIERIDPLDWLKIGKPPFIKLGAPTGDIPFHALHIQGPQA